MNTIEYVLYRFRPRSSKIKKLKITNPITYTLIPTFSNRKYSTTAATVLVTIDTKYKLDSIRTPFAV